MNFKSSKQSPPSLEADPAVKPSSVHPPTLEGPLDSAQELGPKTSLSKRDGVLLAAASAISGIGGLVVMFVVARKLTVGEFADFMLYWSWIFFAFGVLNGIQNEATRATGYTVLRKDDAQRGNKASILVLALAIGLVLAFLVLAGTLIFGMSTHASIKELLPVLTLVVVVLVFSGQAAVAGISAGLGKWRSSAFVLGCDALLRTFAVVGVALLSARLSSIEIAVGTGALTWLVLSVFSPEIRALLKAKADVNYARLTLNTFFSMLSSAATAILVIGFPILLRMTSTASEYASYGGLLLVVSLTRAPIMMPLYAFQGVVLRYFISKESGRAKGYAVLFVGLLGVGLLGAVLGYFIGPWILSIFKPEFHIPGWVVAGMTFDAAIFAILTLTGTANLASNRHVSFMVGWVVASVVTCVVLLLPLAGSVRSVLALLIGPLFGVAIHLGSLGWVGARGKRLVRAL